MSDKSNDWMNQTYSYTYRYLIKPSDWKKQIDSSWESNVWIQSSFTRKSFRNWIETGTGLFHALLVVKLLGKENFLRLADLRDTKLGMEQGAEGILANEEGLRKELVRFSLRYLAEHEEQFTEAMKWIARMDEDIEDLFRLTFLNELRSFEEQTSDAIHRLSLRFLDPADGQDLIDLCSGQGSFLAVVQQKHPKVHLYGQEINEYSCFLSRVRLWLSGSEDFLIRQGDVLKDPWIERDGSIRKFDRVFSNFPYLTRFDAKTIDTYRTQWTHVPIDVSVRNTSDWLFVGQALNMLRPGGKAVALISNGALSKMTDTAIRTRLVEEGRVEAVIQLPEDRSRAARIASCLIVLGSGNRSIRMLDASRMSFEMNWTGYINKMNWDDMIWSLWSEGEGENRREVTFEEIIERDGVLLPDRYMNDSVTDLPYPARLGEVASRIFRGLQASNEEIEHMSDEDSPHLPWWTLIGISNLSDGEIRLDKSTRLPARDRRYERYLLQAGDIVLPAKGTNLKTSIAEPREDERIIATGNLIVIRVDPSRVDPYYLKVFLDSRHGQKNLMRLQTGSVIQNLNPSQLEDLVISLPSLNIQKSIAAQYIEKRQIISSTKLMLRELEEEALELYDRWVEEEGHASRNG